MFMRHGKTQLNEESKCVGSLDVPLNASGRKQASEAAERLKGRQGVDLIVSSPMIRALETAQIIAHSLGIPVHEEPRLRERCVGVIEGKPETPESDSLLLRYDYLPQGAESLEDFEEETKEFLADCADGAFSRNILFVTHGFRMLTIVKLIKGWSVEQIMDYTPPGNCELITFFVVPPCRRCGNMWFV
jgi:probable phosphoglycerate mutase